MNSHVVYFVTENQSKSQQFYQRWQQNIELNIEMKIVSCSHVYTIAKEDFKAIFCWDEDLLDFLRECVLVCPSIQAYVLSERRSKVLRKATATGAIDVWGWEDVLQNLQLLLFSNPQKKENPRPENVQTVVNHEVQKEPVSSLSGKATLFAFTSGKGGVGQTISGISFAAAVHKLTGRRTAFLDLSEGSGDAYRYLRFENNPNLDDWVRYPANMTERQVLQGMHDHPHGGFYTLTLPKGKQILSPHLVQKVLQNTSKFCDYLIVDVGKGWGPIAMDILGLSHHILVVTTPATLEIRNTQDYLFWLNHHGISLGKVRIVVNREAKHYKIDAKGVETILHHQVLAPLPETIELEQCILSQEVPFLSGSKGLAGYRESIKSWVEFYIPHHLLLKKPEQVKKLLSFGRT